jgi:hypothetical protein
VSTGDPLIWTVQVGRVVKNSVNSCLERSFIEDPKIAAFYLDMNKARILARMHGKARRAAPGWV